MDSFKDIDDELVSESVADNKVENLELDTQTASVTKPSSQIAESISNTAADPRTLANNSLFNSNFYFEYVAKTYIDKWQSNFQYILGSCNPAFIDATLSYQDIAEGLHLEPNPNGILWRVNAAGTPHPEDLDMYLEQIRVFKGTTNRTVIDIQIHDSSSSLVQISGSNDNGFTGSFSDNRSSRILTKNNISDIIKELLAKGIDGIILDGQYIDIKGWNEHYNEIQKKIKALLNAKDRFSVLNSDQNSIKNMIATGKYTVTPIDYDDDFNFGYDPFPFYPLTPKGTQDFYFSRSGRQAYHMLAANAWDLAPTMIDVLLVANPEFWELMPYYSKIKPAISAICEVEKNMHLHWEEVEQRQYSYLNAIKQSLLPLGLDLGPVGYTAQNVSKVIARKYGLPEVVKPVLETVLSKIMSNIIEDVAQL